MDELGYALSLRYNGAIMTNSNQSKWPYIVLSLVILVIALWLSKRDSSSINPSTSSVSTGAVEYMVTEVASGLTVPWSIAFTSASRMLVTERPGQVRVIENGSLQPLPLHSFADVAARSESGLMGLTVDPNYNRNHYIYVAYSYMDGSTMRVKVVRLTDEGDQLVSPQVIIDKIPAASNHAGCRIKFGPDGKLYITTGDATERSLAQNLSSLGGKILRINADGTIPADNPFKDSPVWSYGHRNPQGLDWLGAQLYASEHGPSGFDGPGGGDEINLITKGSNFGWPLVSHEKTQEGTVAPLRIYTPAEAPSGLMVYSGKMFPQFKNNIFVGALKGTGILRLTVVDSHITASDKMSEINFGRIREVVEGPDGAIYFSTSNRDGRGQARSGDDHIYKLEAKS